MKKIVLDAFGCDSPAAMLTGAGAAIRAFPDVTFVLHGNPDTVRAALGELAGRAELPPAPAVIRNDENPLTAVMKKRDSSLVAGMEALRRDPDTLGLITAGSTGAALAASAAFLGRLPGVETPALATYLPNARGDFSLLLDCGANVDLTPAGLARFALLGAALAESRGRENPTLSLVSVGTEDGKGNAFTHAAFPLLRALPVNFVGNMEARDALSGRYDVLLCDGFTGNVLLKSIEGSAMFVLSAMKESLAAALPAGVDPACLAPAFGAVLARLDLSSLGGAMILGVKKPIVKCHGNANEKTAVGAVRQLLELAAGDFAARAAARLSE